MSTIGNKIVLDGEDQIQKALYAIQQEYTQLQASLKQVSATCADSANSMEALTAKGEALTKMVAAQASQVEILKDAVQRAQTQNDAYARSVEETRNKLAGYEQSLSQVTDGMEGADEERARLQEGSAKLRETLALQAVAAQAAADTQRHWEGQLNTAQAELLGLNTALKQNDRCLEEAGNSTDQYAASMDKYGNAIQDAARDEQQLGKGAAEAAVQCGPTFSSSGIMQGLKQIADGFMACINASAEFESAISGVLKTVEGTDARRSAVSDEIREISLTMPVAATEIASVAEAAVKLGIAAEDVVSFTRVMLDLGNTTDVTAEQATAALAQFAEATGMGSDKYERLGAVVAALDDEFGAAASDVIVMGQRLAAAGTQCGLTEAQILGMAAALTNAGLEAQTGGAAVSALMTELHTAVEAGSADLTQYAEVAGMTAGQFSALFQQDAAQAMQTFFQGLGSGSESAEAVLQRFSKAGDDVGGCMQRLAGSGDLFNRALGAAAGAWDQNVALARKAAKQYETTESRVQLAANALENLKVVIGDQLSPSFDAATDAGKGLMEWAAGVIAACPLLVDLLAGVTAGLGALALGVTGVTIAINVIKPIWEAFNATAAASPIGWIAVAVGAATTAFTLLSRAIGETPSALDLAADAVHRFAEAQQRVETADNTQALIDRYRALKSSIEGGKLSSDELSAAQQELAEVKRQLIDLSGGLISATDAESDAFADQLDALESMTEAQRELAQMEMLDAVRSFGSTYADAMREQQKASDQAAQAHHKWKMLMDGAFNQTGQSILSLEADAKQLRSDVQNGLTETESGLAEYASRLADLRAGLETITEGEYTFAEGDLAGAMQAIQSVSESAQQLTEVWSDNEQKAAELTQTIDQGLAQALFLVESGVLTTEQAAGMLNLTVGEMQALFSSAAEAAGNAAAALTEAEQAKLAAVQQSTAAISADMDALLQRYDEAKNQALNMAQGVAGAFEEISGSTEASLEEMQSALSSQAAYWEEYNGALASALEKVDPEMQDFILSFANGSQESLGYLEAIAGGSQEDIAALCENMRGVQQGHDDFATIIAGTVTNFDENMNLLQRRMEQAVSEANEGIEGWTEAGANAIQGYINGMVSKMSALQEVSRNMSQVGVRTAKQTTGQRSPSKVYHQIGALDMEGYVQGVQSMQSRIEQALAGISQTGVEAYDLSEIHAANRSAARSAAAADLATERTAVQGVAGAGMRAALYVDGRLLGEILTPYVSGSLALETVQQSRMRGGR